MILPVADTTTEWYNYANHEWANAILINQSNASIKNKYINSDGSFKAGTIVSVNDILQMYGLVEAKVIVMVQ